MKYTGVVFDLNGTIIADTHLHNRAWDLFLDRRSMRLSDREKNERLHGKQNRDIMRSLFGPGLDEPTMDRYIEEKEGCYRDLFREEGVGFIPGFTDFLRFLRIRGVPFGIATSSGPSTVGFYERELDLYSWFDRGAVVFNDGCLRSKPDPEMFLLAMDRIGRNPPDCVIFEDSFTGITAAERSGAGKVVIVNSCGEDYSRYAHTVIGDFTEVDRGLF